jgi:hypothetical protein
VVVIRLVRALAARFRAKLAARDQEDIRPDPTLDAALAAQLTAAGFTDAQLTALKGIWERNARTLAQSHRLIFGLGRLIRGRLRLLFLMLLAIGLFSYHLQVDAKDTADHVAAQAEMAARSYARAVQTSRYDGALASCEDTNVKHAKELIALSNLLDTLGGGTFGRHLVVSAVNAGWPLRDGQGGRETCQRYARAEVKLKLNVSTKNRGAK